MKRRSIQNNLDLINNPEYIPDIFLYNILPNEDTLCIMCKQGNQFGLKLTNQMELKEIYEIEEGHASLEDRNGLDPQGVWASLYPIDLGVTQTKPAWIHFTCAIYSPLTWLRGTEWHNLKCEVKRSQGLECCHCKKKGATVGCVIQRCNYIIHVSCAISLGWKPTILRKRFLCQHHQNKQVAAETELDLEYLYDISKGQESYFITMESPNGGLVTGAVASQSFKYITFNKDSDEAESFIFNTNNLPYCDCSKNCVNLDGGCECSERNIIISNQINLNSTCIVTECGLRCDCSIGKCPKRNLSRGLKWKLYIFIHSGLNSDTKRNFMLLDEEISDSETNSSSSSNCCIVNEKIVYGVRTKDFIPNGSFVCEIVGQYKIANSSSEISNLLEKNNVYFITKWISDCKKQESTTINQNENLDDILMTDSEIYLDCRVYRNVGSFVRCGKQSNVIKKIGYVDQTNYRYPRLLLYASRDIGVDEEILL